MKSREFIGPKGKLIHTDGSIGVDINSSKICNDLVKLGIGYNKSYANLHIPNINSELIRHFIRGYFDGDGSFSLFIHSPKDRPNTYLKCKFSIDSKTCSILEDIQKELSKYNIKTSIIYLKRNDMWRISTGSKVEAKKLYQYLYKDSNFYLTRKYNKFVYYVNTEESQIISDLRNA